MTDRADRAITALRTGHDELTSFVAGLAVEELDRTSAAREWTVAHVLGHLGSGAEIMLATLDGALTGTSGPDIDSMRAVWSRWNAMSAVEQAVQFAQVDEMVVSRFERLDRAARDDLRIDLGFLPQPIDVASTAALRLNELTYHAWDIEVVFDPTAELATGAVELLFQPLEMLIGFIGQPVGLPGRRVTLAVHTTDPEGSFGLVLADPISLGTQPVAADGELTIPAAALLRLTAGRLSPEHTPPGIRLTGEVVTLDDLRRVFPGF